MASFNCKYYKTQKWQSLSVYEQNFCQYIGQRYNYKEHKNTYVTIDTMLLELNISKETLSKYIKLLEDKGIIKVIRYKYKKSNRLSDEYELLDINDNDINEYLIKWPIKHRNMNINSISNLKVGINRKVAVPDSIRDSVIYSVPDSIVKVVPIVSESSSDGMGHQDTRSILQLQDTRIRKTSPSYQPVTYIEYDLIKDVIDNDDKKEITRLFNMTLDDKINLFNKYKDTDYSKWLLVSRYGDYRLVEDHLFDLEHPEYR